MSSRRTPIRKTSPVGPTESEKSYEFKRLSTDSLFTPLEHPGIDQKNDETCFVIKAELWNNTPTMLYEAICALVTKCDSMSAL